MAAGEKIKTEDWEGIAKEEKGRRGERERDVAKKFGL